MNKKISRISFLIFLFFVFYLLTSATDKNDVNMVKNGDFSKGTNEWYIWFSPGNNGLGDFEVKKGIAVISISDPGEVLWALGISHQGLNIIKNNTYKISFDAKADKPRTICHKLGLCREPYISYIEQKFDLTNEWKTFTYQFKMTYDSDSNTEINFQFGTNSETVYIDNVIVEEVK